LLLELNAIQKHLTSGLKTFGSYCICTGW